jgi:hypothetical protein
VFRFFWLFVTGVAFFSILFLPTNQYHWRPFSGLRRCVAQLGPSRAVRARLDPWNSGPNQS